MNSTKRNPIIEKRHPLRGMAYTGKPASTPYTHDILHTFKRHRVSTRAEINDFH